MKNSPLLLGAILGAHGLKGAVRVRSFAEEPENLFIYSPITNETGERVFALHCIGVMKDHFLSTIKGVKTREEAEALKGTKLYVARKDLPDTDEREYYEADLVGLDVQDESGAPIGKVEALHDYGAGAFLEIKPTKGPSFMLPFKDAFVPTVDLEHGFIVAQIPEGWLKPEKDEP